MHGCTTLLTNTQLSHRGVFPALILSSHFTGTILQGPTMSFVWQKAQGLRHGGLSPKLPRSAIAAP